VDPFERKVVLRNERCLGRRLSGLIGPEFLRNYRFTIDPFEKALVLEKPSAPMSAGKHG
jgi:hypothetical protein